MPIQRRNAKPTKPIKPTTMRRTTRRVHTAMIAPAIDMAPSPWGILGQIPRAKGFAFFLVLLFSVGLFLFFDLDTFYVYRFEASGLQYVTLSEIEKASGFLDYNIFFVDARAAERAILKMPEVKSVRVATSLPNRVSVVIEERQPEVIWQRGPENYWVDADGIVFRARANLANLPTLRDADTSPIKLGQKLYAAPLEAYRSLHATWSEAPRTLEWSNLRGLAYTDEHGWKIYLGDASEMAGKLAKLRALVPQLVGKNPPVKFIDVSKGDPYYQ
jgi:cell division septal protein FtsQ